MKKIRKFTAGILLICFMLLNVSAVYADEGFSGAFSPDVRLYAVYNDPNGCLSAISAGCNSDNPVYLYGDGDYGHPTVMAIYYFSLATIKKQISSDTNVKAIYFGLYDFMNLADSDTRLYAHKVLDDVSSYTTNTKYTNDEGPAYIDEPFAVSTYNDAKPDSSITSSHDYYIDLTDLYLEAVDSGDTGITFAVSSNEGSADVSSKVATGGSTFRMKAGRLFVQYSDEEQTLNRAPVISEISAASQSAPVGSSVTVSANVADSDGSVADVNFKIAGQKYAAESDGNGTYTATVAVPDEAGEYTVSVIAKDEDGAVNTEIMESKIKAYTASETLTYAGKTHTISGAAFKTVSTGTFSQTAYYGIRGDGLGDSAEITYAKWPISSAESGKSIKKVEFVVAITQDTSTETVKVTSGYDDIKIQLHDVEDTSWTKDDLTYDTKPDFEKEAFAEGCALRYTPYTLGYNSLVTDSSLGAGHNYTIDITDYVLEKLALGKDAVSFAITGSEGAPTTVDQLFKTAVRLLYTYTDNSAAVVTLSGSSAVPFGSSDSIAVSAEDSDGTVESLKYYFDGEELQSGTILASLITNDKEHVFKAVAEDNLGLKSVAAMKIYNQIIFENGAFSTDGDTVSYAVDYEIKDTSVDAPILIIAAYDEGKNLIDSAFGTDESESGSLTASVSSAEALSYRAFLWDNLNNLTPVSGSADK